MTDLIGPGSNATNVVTARPAETRTFGPLDTWFKDCSSPAAGDGTRVPAAFLNALAALVRQAIRQAGVAENNGDDLMLWKAMQAASAAPALVVHRGAGTGTANALAVTVTPAVTAYVDGDIYEIAPVATSTLTTPTLAVSELAAKTIVHADGSELLPGELVADAKMLMAYSQALDKIVLLGTTKAYVDKAIAAKGSLIGVRMITTTSTYTRRSGATMELVFATGAGGGGAYIGSGGGGGATAVYFGSADSVPVTVGAGGAAGTSGAYTGGDGGSTSFGTLATASGGKGGWGVTPGSGGATGTGLFVLPGGNAPEHGTMGGAGGGGLFGLGGGAGGEGSSSGLYNPRASTAGQFGGGGGGGDIDSVANVGSAGGNGCVLILEFT